MAETFRVALAHIVHVGEISGVHDLLQPIEVALLPQRGLEFGGAVEMVLERVLVAAGHQEHIVEARVDGLLDHVLDGRLVDDGKHLLRHRLGRRKESGAEPRCRNNCLGHFDCHVGQVIGI